MQLGTRWSTGTEPPRAVPDVLRPAIAALETQLDVVRGSWTLTFLEGRPIAELDAGYEVFLDAAGTVVSRPFQD